MAAPGVLGGPVTKDQLTIALRAGRQVLPSVYLLGNLAGHNNNYTNKFQLFIGSGKVAFLDKYTYPTAPLFLSQPQLQGKRVNCNLDRQVITSFKCYFLG